MKYVYEDFNNYTLEETLEILKKEIRFVVLLVAKAKKKN